MSAVTSAAGDSAGSRRFQINDRYGKIDLLDQEIKKGGLIEIPKRTVQHRNREYNGFNAKKGTRGKTSEEKEEIQI